MAAFTGVGLALGDIAGAGQELDRANAQLRQASPPATPPQVRPQGPLGMPAGFLGL